MASICLAGIWWWVIYEAVWMHFFLGGRAGQANAVSVEEWISSLFQEEHIYVRWRYRPIRLVDVRTMTMSIFEYLWGAHFAISFGQIAPTGGSSLFAYNLVKYPKHDLKNKDQLLVLIWEFPKGIVAMYNCISTLMYYVDRCRLPKVLYRGIELPLDMLDIEKDLQKNRMKTCHHKHCKEKSYGTSSWHCL